MLAQPLLPRVGSRDAVRAGGGMRMSAARQEGLSHDEPTAAFGRHDQVLDTSSSATTITPSLWIEHGVVALSVTLVVFYPPASLKNSTQSHHALERLAVLLVAIFSVPSALRCRSQSSDRPGSSPGVVIGLTSVPAALFVVLSASTSTSLYQFERFWLSIAASTYGIGALLTLQRPIPRLSLTVITSALLFGTCSLAALSTSQSVLMLVYCSFGLGTFISVLYLLLNGTTRSFTVGEAAIISSLVSILSADTMLTALQSFGGGHMGFDPMHRAIQSGHIGAIIIMIVTTVPFLQTSVSGRHAPLRQSNRGEVHESSSVFTNEHSLSKRESMFYWALFGACLGVVVMGMWAAIRSFPLLWVAQYLIERNYVRILLIGYWVLVLVPVLVGGKAIQSMPVRKIIRRKAYHAIAVALFVPGALLDHDFLCLSYAVASSIFLVFEGIRIVKPWPVRDSLHNFMVQFCDSRDVGFMILTHIYLLAGCALTSWLSMEVGLPFRKGPRFVVGTLGGVLCLGIGDAVASVVGSYWGTIKWPGSQKSIQGTLAGAAAVVLAACITLLIGSLLHVVDMENSWPRTLLSLVVAVSLTSILEATTDQIDNLVLPLHFFYVWYVVS